MVSRTTCGGTTTGWSGVPNIPCNSSKARRLAGLPVATRSFPSSSRSGRIRLLRAKASGRRAISAVSNDPSSISRWNGKPSRPAIISMSLFWFIWLVTRRLFCGARRPLRLQFAAQGERLVAFHRGIEFHLLALGNLGHFLGAPDDARSKDDHQVGLCPLRVPGLEKIAEQRDVAEQRD